MVLASTGPTVSLPIECESRCSGTLTIIAVGSSLRLGVRQGQASSARTVVIGRARFTLPAGTRRTVRLTLSAAARKRLQTAAHGLRTTVVIDVRLGFGARKTYREPLTIARFRHTKGRSERIHNAG
jgi:hypothetical protein